LENNYSPHKNQIAASMDEMCEAKGTKSKQEVKSKGKDSSQGMEFIDAAESPWGRVGEELPPEKR
jgi:hypothetical protein